MNVACAALKELERPSAYRLRAITIQSYSWNEIRIVAC